MNLSVEERRALHAKLLEVTREGTITGWAERIAQFVQTAGYPVERINWSGSPDIVVYHVIEFAEKWDIKPLKQALS